MPQHFIWGEFVENSVNNKMNLVILPFHDWKKNEIEGFRNRDGHLIQHFEKDNRINKILVVDRPVSFPEMVLKRRPWRIRNGEVLKKNFPYCLTQVSDKTFVLDIFSGDIFRPLVMQRDWWSFIFRQPRIIKIIKENVSYLNIENPILFSWSPMCSGIFGKLDERLLVFDIMDNWLKHPEIEDKRKLIATTFRKIKKEADIIFVVSQVLKEEFSDAKGLVSLIPNGVDQEFFKVTQREVPSGLRELSRPIVGYAGHLGKRIDIALLSFLAQQLSRINFIFLGSFLDKRWVRSLFKYKNIHFLGDKHYSQLPSYLNSFDICIIPHNVGELENEGDPIKLYEYLAAGKPVVTTPIAGVDVFKDVITIARTKEEFRDGIIYWLKRIKEEPNLSEKLRANITKEHLWSTKAEQMLDIIEEKVKEIA